MKFLRTHHKAAAAVLIGILLFLGLTAVPTLAGDCERGLVKCGIDSAIVGLFGGIQSGLLYFSGCLIGYGWCLAYY